jgi:hypothetical protein
MMNMLIRPIDGTETEGIRLTAGILAVAENPPVAPFLTFAERRTVLDGQGFLWTLSDDGTVVERMIVLSCRCGHVELTTYVDSVEVSREIVSTEVR